MGCLYYIPARRFQDERVPDTLKGDALALYGLGQLDGADLSFRGVLNKGPDGGRGLCIGLGFPASKTGIFEGQTWKACAGGDLFMGWPTAQGPPGPDTFVRKDLAPTAFSCVLGDGKVWEFTPVRDLPMVLTYDSAGEVVRVPREADQAHAAASDWLLEFATAGSMETSLLEIYGHITTCLAARYRLSMLEAMVLGLYHDDTYHRAVVAALGIDREKVTAAVSAEDDSTRSGEVS